LIRLGGILIDSIQSVEIMRMMVLKDKYHNGYTVL